MTKHLDANKTNASVVDNFADKCQIAPASQSAIKS